MRDTISIRKINYKAFSCLHLPTNYQQSPQSIHALLFVIRGQIRLRNIFTLAKYSVITFLIYYEDTFIKILLQQIIRGACFSKNEEPSCGQGLVTVNNLRY